ncbi:hypothetical protein Tco_1556496 [Tanacetum coccineum]
METECLGTKPQADMLNTLKRLIKNVVIGAIDKKKVLGGVLMVMVNPDDEDMFWEFTAGLEYSELEATWFFRSTYSVMKQD